MPVTDLCFPGFSLFRFNSWAIFFLRIPLTKVDFPEPETPVTAINFPSGNLTDTFLRLFSLAPLTSIKRPLPTRRSVGTGIDLAPDKYCPVIDFLFLATSSGVPEAMICPPKAPAPGPTSMSQSASRMVSSSCSTTIKVLPKSRIFLRLEIKRSLSR